MFYVYIIYSKTLDIYYKGFSEDVVQRLLHHNENRSRYTSNKGPWELVYSKAFETKKEALIEELRLKKLNRKSIEDLIKEYK
ncbi:GIY-YIG nuclease family protein [Flavobacterium sp. ACN6]|uniref:GIY-YIG nuclease family protein n=1 Tax=Flavobacterium sp. ACN6 TaxID=1920426 RepID=UPI000BB3D2DA|nr:GIY-YIG nuclease family protein [Flavobacterium sp. ACN6]PBJ13075.1 GIY-YIG nuclease superfamily protein [Flavobacterium sp. ACN6]PBJ13076.1 GIY-YIG nuclease superfamily protein [Flavobacterium sp. ACN6]